MCSLRSGLLDARRLLERGIKIGLGTGKEWRSGSLLGEGREGGRAHPTKLPSPLENLYL